MKELLEAIEHDNLVKMKALLELGIDLSAPILIGEEYELEDYDEISLLFYVIRNHGSMEAIEMLLGYGLDIKECNDMGISALDTAIKFKRHDMIELCINKGLDVNVSNRRSGITPLMLASCFSNIRTAELLLASGADINAIDRAGMSPKDYARKLGQKKMQEFLAERGGEFSAYQEIS
ncbi:MAG: ankyrin repeat domain-containing protein [Epsilonproteobacteria bacterium]|nr:MAG: ankyrin repeat domain-containing protein [Campylobacterota bacterium]